MSDSDPPTEAQATAVTIATYDQIATAYATAWQDRGSLELNLARFAALVQPGGVVADVGSGPGFDTAVLQQRGFRVIGLDLSWGMMQAGRQQGIAVDFVQADMGALPLATAVDGLWVCASLLHLPRAATPAALRGFARSAKAGGVLHLSMKLGLAERWEAESYGRPSPRFFTYWTPEELDRLLADTGWRVVDGWQSEGRRDTWLTRFAVKSA